MTSTPRGPTVAIVGAGPVGLLCAALLLHDPRAPYIKVRVLDPRAPERWRADRTDLRVYALSRASQRLLEGLGLWSAVLERRASAYRTMHVWEGPDSHGPGAVTFDAAEIGEPDLGHIVEDVLLRELLLDAVVRSGRAEISTGAGLASLRLAAGRAELTTASGEAIAADVVVGADGGASRVRTALAIPAIERDYGQSAVVTHVVTAVPHGRRALQRFLPGGPLAFLPLADGRCSIVWSLPSAEAARLTECPDSEFITELETASAGVLGALGPVDARTRFPLTMLHALEYCRESAVLIGDAAHCVHPLAGQGMNLGFLDAACLADVLGEALARGEHPGDARVLRRYARRRKGHNLEMLAAFDALDRLFRLPGWAAPARVLGLAAVDRGLPLKTALMRRALGLGDRLSGTRGGRARPQERT